jgi:zinc transport system substrate-binding protein
MERIIDRAALRGISLIGLLLLPACGGCSNGGRAPHGGASPDGARGAVLRVEAVSYPLRFLAERIGGERVEVSFRAPAGADPAFWSPDAGAIAAMQAADLVLLNGAGYGRWIDRTSLPLSRLVDTSRGFRDRYLTVDRAVTHSHGPEGEHSHGEIAFTTWLDPIQAIEQAAAIRDAFKAARPVFAAEFERRFTGLESDLRDVDRILEEAFGRLDGAPLLASHPVYQYLARRYRLELTSVHFEPDEPPTEQGWRELEGLRTAHRARWMLWEKEPLAATAYRLEALGIGIIVFDPCAGTPASGDFLTVLHDNAQRVAAAARLPVGRAGTVNPPSLIRGIHTSRPPAPQAVRTESCRCARMPPALISRMFARPARTEEVEWPCPGSHVSVSALFCCWPACRRRPTI